MNPKLISSLMSPIANGCVESLLNSDITESGCWYELRNLRIETKVWKLKYPITSYKNSDFAKFLDQN